MFFGKLITLIVVTNPVFGQEVNYLDTIFVQDEVSISDEQILGAELTSEQVENFNPSSLDDLLKLSVSTTTTGGPRSSSESVQIRGMDASKLYIYIDGVKQNFRTDHNTMIAFDYDNLKSGVIENDNSNLSHSGSLGGGLILTTKSAKDFLTSNETSGAQLKLSSQNSNKEFSKNIKTYSKLFQNSWILLSVGQKKADDTVLANRYTLVNSGYEDSSFFVKINSKKSEISADYFNRKDSAPMNPTQDSPVDIKELESKNIIRRSGLSAKTQINKISMSSFINVQSLKKERQSDKAVENRKIQTVGANLKWNGFVNVGAEYVQDKLNGDRSGDTLESYPNGLSQNISVYVDKKTLITKSFLMDAGLKVQRFDLENKISDEGLSAKFGLNYEISKHFKTGVMATTGFNPPKIQEVYADGLHHAGDGFFIADNFFIINENLKSEYSKSFELVNTFETKIGRIGQASLSYKRYWSHFDNYIYLEKIDRAIFDGENGTTQFVNARDVSLNGHEVSGSLLLKQLELSVSYSRIRAFNKTLALYIEGLPADQYNYSLTYFLDKIDAQVGYLGVNALKQDRINRNTTQRQDETPGYFVHNIFAKKNFDSGYSLGTRIDNLTNRIYRKHSSNIVESGRDYKITLEYKINI